MNVNIRVLDNQKADVDQILYPDYDEDFRSDIWPITSSKHTTEFKIFSATPSVTVENIHDIIEKDRRHQF